MAPYDAIISVGAFEHFARTSAPPAEKIGRYRAFFTRCRAFLRPGGHLSLQTIAVGSAPFSRRLLADALFIEQEVFPESQVPRLPEIVEASEETLDLVALQSDGAGYARTCAEWLARLRARRSEAVSVAGEEIVARYERYLDTCVRLFRGRQMTLLRLTFQRN